MEYRITMITGAVPGHDQPSICHSGKPKKTKCYAGTAHPGSDGWVFTRHSPPYDTRDGWWCPDCAAQLRQALEDNGITPTHRDVPLPSPGSA